MSFDISPSFPFISGLMERPFPVSILFMAVSVAYGRSGMAGPRMSFFCRLDEISDQQDIGDQ